MAYLKPFADDVSSAAIGDLTNENGRDRLAIYGTVDISRDKAGLELAWRLKRLLDHVVVELERGKVPDIVARTIKPTVGKRPYA
jgi:hypothetical protein